MSTVIVDKEKYKEVCKEIEIKEYRLEFLVQEISLLRRYKKLLKEGLSFDEIKEKYEHNPFDDIKFFGTI